VPPPPDAPRRALSLRQRLLLLTVGALLPLAIAAGLALQALLDQQRQQTEQSSLDLTRALATAVDTELRLTVSALQALAATEPLADDHPADIEAFYRLARRVLTERVEWRAILLAEPSGQVLFSTAYPLGAGQPTLAETESFTETVRRRSPQIGNFARGVRGQAGIPVRIPILRDGEVAFVLTAVVKPDAILRVVQQQRVPADWVVSVFDGKDARVARSRDHEGTLGTPPTQSLLDLKRLHVDEGTGRSVTLEGEHVFTAFTRLKSIGWTVAIGVPTAIAESAWRQSAVAYGGGILLSLGVGALAAWLIARSIAGPIGRLRESALAIGRGEVPAREQSRLLEVQAAADALVSAAESRERAEADRERLLGAERSARTSAEQAQHRLQLLAGAGSLLSRSLEEKTTLEAIASVIVPDIADWCRIDLLDEHGVLQRKLTYHSDPERRRAIAEMVTGMQVSPQTPGSFPYVIATGKPYLANFESPETSGIAEPAFLAFAKATGMRATCVVPLIARGRTIGAMGAIQAESGRQYSAEDGVLLGELAQRAALALDNVRLFAEAQAALHEAEIANRAKDDFLAMLGHELRNPLAPIVTSLAVMARRDPDAAAPQRLVIERQVAHLSQLVDDLLDVSRIASGKIRLKLERLDLRSVVGRALELVEPAMEARVHRPDVALPAAPVWVQGDSLRLAQIVSNLLTNAAKFSRVEDRIALDLRADGEEARLTVTDQGVGIQPKLLARVFERFVQGEQALQRAEGGLGLGLAIAQSLVLLHHGRISAESQGTGRGSRFTVTLPLAPEEAEAPAADRTPPGSASRAARVLLVDDNSDAVEALAELLRMEGYEVVSAGSAEIALEHVESFRPHAALLDIGLPKMNGYDLARALRSRPSLRSLRLIALTGYGRAPDRQRAFDAGFDEHFVKPAPLDELLSRLAALVDPEPAAS
jgi:signal transduction histidine kinase/ActR/RegA family two-component response regulator